MVLRSTYRPTLTHRPRAIYAALVPPPPTASNATTASTATAAAAATAQVALTKQHPKDPTTKDDKGDALEPGRNLFNAFRPCYIRAYNDAKDVLDDGGGKVLEGTKSSTADDFVSNISVVQCAYRRKRAGPVGRGGRPGT